METEIALKTSQITARLERLPVSRLHYRLLCIHGMGWLFDAMDVGIITFIVAALVSAWKIAPAQVGYIVSSGLAGMFVGALFSGILADYYGRKFVFQSTLLIFTISSLLCAISWSVGSLLLFRFFVGVGLGGELPVVSSLLSEFVPGKSRGWFIVLLESFWAYGWVTAAIISFLVIPAYGWRTAFIIGALPAFYIWYIRRKLPESPRWYASKGRFEEAEKTMSDLEKESERITQKTLPSPSFHSVVEYKASKFTFAELWSGNYLKRTLMLWILWFCIVFGYYGIFGWLPTLLVKSGFTVVRSFMYVLIITLAQIPGYFTAAFLIERMGRKWVLVTFLLLSAATGFFYGRSNSVAEILIWGCLMSFFNLGAWGGVYAYTPELYPTRARATGAGSAAAFGRIGGIIAPTVIGILLGRLGVPGIFALNALMFFIASIAVATLGIETKGKTLEEISA